MISSMLVTALTPIFAMIALGFAIARTPIAGPGAWELIERLTYYLFFPALLVLRLSDSRFRGEQLQDIVLVLLIAVGVLSILLVGLRKFIAADASTFSSVFQGSIRFNTYIGLAIIESLYGDAGLTRAALCLVVFIPLVNFLSVISLTAGSGELGRRLVIVVGSVLTNPLVLACGVGLALSYSNFALPELAEAVVGILSQPALPLGLLAVGAGIRFVAIGEQSWPLIVALIAKLGALPSLVLLVCVVFQINNQLAQVLLIFAALPSPPSAYILARQLNGNVTLMANIITLQTLAVFFMLPLWLQLSQRFL